MTTPQEHIQKSDVTLNMADSVPAAEASSEAQVITLSLLFAEAQAHAAIATAMLLHETVHPRSTHVRHDHTFDRPAGA